ncbi:MAG: hypothetical protein ACXABE_00430 [Candidatus Thorarchaeota archaeon]|jgi:hypothetical protein
MSNGDMIVDVWFNSQEAQKGVLSVNSDSVIITLESGDFISSSNSTNILYSLPKDPRISQFRIRFSPVVATIHPYSAEIGQVIEDIFPPSSGGFYGRLQAGTEEAVFLIQDIVNDPRLWLIIGNSKTGRILETQIIHPYEAETLKLLTDSEILNIWDSSFWSEKDEILKKEILGILDKPAPSWKMISRILGGVSISDLKRGNSVRETLTQLVPDSFPEHIRDQLMAFLASVMMDRIRSDEVIDLSSYIHAAPMYSGLLQGHLRSKIDNVAWPPYLEIIRLFSRGQLKQPRRTLQESTDSSWILLWQKMLESFPNWFESAVVSARELNASTKFLPRLPVNKSQASRSRKLMKKRMAAITYGLRLRGHVNPQAIGLTEFVYLGAAYRWPHRHLRYITRLGIASENPPHLQVMTLPLSSAERVMRALPQGIKISWSSRVVNLNLYDKVSKKWMIPIDKIITSATGRSSKRKLVRMFGPSTNSETYKIDNDEAKVLGLVSRDVLLESFEQPDYFSYWNLSNKRVSSIISKLMEKDVLQMTYDVIVSNLASLASIIQGNSRNVASFASSLLTYSPSSVVMANDQFDKAVVLSRFPEDIVFDLVSKLNQQEAQQDFAIRCFRPRAFQTYTYTIYQRLLKPDGTWDDDVSAFLSQARSKRRELSESNA